jgi:hypothetical protein
MTSLRAATSRRTESPDGTRVEVEHRNLERHGEGWEACARLSAARTAGRSTCSGTPKLLAED